jgi:hypothetical protein
MIGFASCETMANKTSNDIPMGQYTVRPDSQRRSLGCNAVIRIPVVRSMELVPGYGVSFEAAACHVVCPLMINYPLRIPLDFFLSSGCRFLLTHVCSLTAGILLLQVNNPVVAGIGTQSRLGFLRVF